MVSQDIDWDLYLTLGKTIGTNLLGDEMLLCNVAFLYCRIPGKLDHFHAIKEGSRYCVKGIGRGDEKYLAEVNGDVDVVVVETVILFRVKHFSIAADGSPWKLFELILSISSRRKTGFATPTFFRPLTMRPGIAAT